MPSTRRGFTLIELLVVIAVIALLIGILLPSLANAKKTARSVLEMSSISQIGKVSASYSVDYKDEIIPARVPKYWDWWQICDTGMYPADPADPKIARLSRETMRTWPWRLIGYSGTPVAGVWVVDKGEYSTIAARGFAGRASTTAGSLTNLFSYPDTSYVAAVAHHPSFGMNSVFVGGDTNHSAFKQHGMTRCGNENILAGTNNKNLGGMFYLTKSSDAQFPSDLLTFAASRASDVSGTGFHGNAQSLADSATSRRDGFFKVLPPTAIPSTEPDHGTSYTMMNGWQPNAPTVYNARSNQSTWGYLNPRYFNTVATTRFDCSAKRMTLEQLKDMRHWDNWATKNTNATTGVYTWRGR